MLKTLKSMAKAVVSPLIDGTGWYDRRLRHASAARGAWTIVMYHRVIDDPAVDPFQLGMCVQQDRFEAQLRYLRSRFQILTVGDAVSRLAQGQPLPQRALSITFDDGYRDNLTHALPVMQRLGLPFSVYVPTEGMAEGRPLWWDRVIAAMACSSRSQFDLADVGLSAESEVVPLGGLNADVYVELVLNRLWDLDKLHCERAVELIEQRLAAKPTPQLQASRLLPSEVLELHRQGVEIGAHSASHPNLELACEDLIRNELQTSRSELESLLQQPVSGLAYPGGRVGRSARQIASELGFAYALATDTGRNLPPYELTRLRRIGMPDAELPDFRRAVGQAMVKLTSNDQLHF